MILSSATKCSLRTSSLSNERGKGVSKRERGKEDVIFPSSSLRDVFEVFFENFLKEEKGGIFGIPPSSSL